MKIFVTADFLHKLLIGNEENRQFCKQELEAYLQKKDGLYLSANSVSDFCASVSALDHRKEIFKHLQVVFEPLIAIDTDNLQTAFSLQQQFSHWSFIDCLQLACALQIGAEQILTTETHWQEQQLIPCRRIIG